MVSRLLRTFLLLLLPSATLLVAAPTPAGRSDAEEAERLYRRANDYVTNISEGEYSYAYLQFYWKRAQANLDRVTRVYPNTATGRKLRLGELKVGPFDPTYFKERVLPRVELKRLGAYDAVNLSIFLYNLEPQRWDHTRLQALEAILEVLARQQRWNEALIFPTRDEDEALKLATVYRIAAHFDQPKVMKMIRERVKPGQVIPFDLIDAEALIYLGRDLATVDAFITGLDRPEPKRAALAALAERELLLRYGYAKEKDLSKGLTTTHFSLLNPSVQDDVKAARARWGLSQDAEAATIEAAFAAATGRVPQANDDVRVHAGYVRSLVKNGQVDVASRHLGAVPAALRGPLQIALVQRLAEYGHGEAAQSLVAEIVRQTPALADDARLASFLGSMECKAPQLTVQPGTFANLPIGDGCVLARAVMHWSLTPNRSIRGAAPWDAVVRRFLPGFENLPLPESSEVGQAASLLKPY